MMPALTSGHTMSQSPERTAERNDVPAKDYLQEEQKQRREEIEHLIERTESDQRNALLLTGAFWAWMATNTEKLYGPFNNVAALLPTIIMCFFYYRWKMLTNAIDQIADYMKRVEEFFAVPEGLGWETWVKKERHDKGVTEHMEFTTRIFWRALIVVNILIAGLFLYYQGNAPKNVKGSSSDASAVTDTR